MYEAIGEGQVNKEATVHTVLDFRKPVSLVKMSHRYCGDRLSDAEMYSGLWKHRRGAAWRGHAKGLWSMRWLSQVLKDGQWGKFRSRDTSV